ncbi:DUF6973 domain-containing protein [Nocardia bhagyanarayanae]|uniref:DUF6973 domain-containing protein n=1 Tax=Nocardia bhagyanarayanae TaxID=1215925 RepID=UPI001152DF97|nr:hypothetical protein [Nocardia bhagyanarayanae]
MLSWDLRYLGQCVDIMLETAKVIDTEAAAAGGKIEQSEPYFASAAGNASRTRGAADKSDALTTSDVIEEMGKSLRLYVGELESNIAEIREQKKEAEDSIWDLFVTDDGHVKSRKSNWETYKDYFPFGEAAIAAKEFWTRRYDNLISAALTWVQRVDQEGTELYIGKIENLSDRVKQALTALPSDPELARILEEYQTSASTEPPRLWPVGFVADLLEENGIEVAPSLYTANEIAAMEQLYHTQGIEAVGQALKMPDLAKEAALEYSPDTQADGQGDAFRHMYWNALMSQKFGEEWTQTYATAHEKTGGNTPQREAMDLWNNELGRKIGAANPDATPEELQALVRQEIEGENGRAVVITAKDQSGNPLPSDQVQLSWSRSTAPGLTGPPAGVGIPLPGSK